MVIGIIFILFVIIFTKIFHFDSPSYQIRNVKSSAYQSLIIITIELIIGLVYVFIIGKFFKNVSESLIFLLQSLFYFLLTIIVMLVVLHNNENFQSIGITKVNLIKSCVLGILLGIIFLVVYQSNSKTNKLINIISIVSLIPFIKFFIVGFAEEIIFRGYLQTRLIAWQGTIKGCLLTAIIFSFFHLPQRLIFENMNLQSALMSCVSLIPSSLLLGYIMIKTENITAVSIFHTFINWTSTI